MGKCFNNRRYLIALYFSSYVAFAYAYASENQVNFDIKLGDGSNSER